MDTDDLSNEAYEGILIEAEKLSHDLTLHYGLLSGQCKDEAEYLDKAEKLTKKLLKVEADHLEDVFWGNPIPKDKLDKALHQILSNIAEVRNIPEEERRYDDYG
jgi:hypothetical protein